MTENQPQSSPNASLTKDEIFKTLMPIEDPELHIGLIDLGLVYDAKWEPETSRVVIEMTLTSPGCPYGPMLLSQVHQALAKLPAVQEVKIDLVWAPPWDPRTMATEEGKVGLGLL